MRKLRETVVVGLPPLPCHRSPVDLLPPNQPPTYPKT